MSNDRLLIAVNNLIEHFERATTKSISLENESNLDVLQYSNLQKIELMLSAVEIGNNLDVNQSVKEHISTNQTVLVQEEKRSNKKKDFYEECVTAINPDSLTKELEETLTFNKDNPVTNSIQENLYKPAINGLDTATDWLNKNTKELFEEYEDVANCLNCRKPQDFKNPIPPYETAWEFKQLLSNLKELLKDIRLSLDSTQLASDLCSFINIIKQEGYLCLSSYPLIAASIPIIINDARFKLMELGFNWAGIIGGVLSPIVNTLANIIEYFGNIASPILECLVNAFRSLRVALETTYNVGRSLYTQGSRTASVLAGTVMGVKDGIGSLFGAKEQIKGSEKTKAFLKSEEEKLEEMRKQRDSASTDYAKSLINPETNQREGLEEVREEYSEYLETDFVAKKEVESQLQEARTSLKEVNQEIAQLRKDTSKKQAADGYSSFLARYSGERQTDVEKGKLLVEKRHELIQEIRTLSKSLEDFDGNKEEQILNKHEMRLKKLEALKEKDKEYKEAEKQYQLKKQEYLDSIKESKSAKQTIEANTNNRVKREYLAKKRNVTGDVSLSLSSRVPLVEEARSESVERFLKAFLRVENTLVKAQGTVDNFLNKITYLVKSFNRYFVEPAFISSKLIGEIKVAFNTARLVHLIVKISQMGFDDLCKDFEDANNQKLIKSFLEKTFDDVEVSFNKDENEDVFAVVESKRTNYKSRLNPDDCGEVLISINEKQKDLDLIYETLANSLR